MSNPMAVPTDLLAIKPREAQVVVARVLRQARWDWGLEPSVGSMVLAAHRRGLDGLGVLDRDWELIASARPKAMTATATGPGSWRFDAGGCHAFVAAPSILDYLLAGAADGRASVIVEGAASPGLLEALGFFGSRYGFSLSVDNQGNRTTLDALRGETRPSGRNPSTLQAGDYHVNVAVWNRLLARSASYLIPDTELSRAHAGDGTRAFPLQPAPALHGQKEPSC